MADPTTEFLKKLVGALRAGPKGGPKYELPKDAQVVFAAYLAAITDGMQLLTTLDRLMLFGARLLLDEEAPEAAGQVIDLATTALPNLRLLDAEAAKRAEKNLDEAKKQADGFSQRFVRPKGPPGGLPDI